MDAVKSKVNAEGLVLIPAEFLKALGLDVGQSVLLTLDEQGLRITPQRRNLERAQASVRRHVPEGVSLADALIAERRREAGS